MMSSQDQNNSPFLFSDVTANNSAAVLADMNNNLVALVNAISGGSILITVLQALVTATQGINTTLGTINSTLVIGNGYLNNIHGDLSAINTDLQNIYNALLLSNTNTANIYSELVIIDSTLVAGNINTAAINNDLTEMNGILGSIDNDLKNINSSIITWSGNINATLQEINTDLAPWIVDGVPYTLAQSSYQTGFVDLIPVATPPAHPGALGTIAEMLASINYFGLGAISSPPLPLGLLGAMEYANDIFQNALLSNQFSLYNPNPLYNSPSQNNLSSLRTTTTTPIGIGDILNISLLTDGLTPALAAQNNLAALWTTPDTDTLYTAQRVSDLLKVPPTAAYAANKSITSVLGNALNTSTIDPVTELPVGVTDILNISLLTDGLTPAIPTNNNLSGLWLVDEETDTFESITTVLAAALTSTDSDMGLADITNAALLTGGFSAAPASQNNLASIAGNIGTFTSPDEVLSNLSLAQTIGFYTMGTLSFPNGVENPLTVVGGGAPWVEDFFTFAGA